MKLYERDFFVARIRAGYISFKIDDKRIIVRQPDDDIAVEAEELYIESYEKAIEENILDDNDILDFLIIHDLWSEQKEKEYLEIVPKHIEYWKVELYNSILKSSTRKQVRKYLEIAKQEFSDLHNLRHSYDYATCAGYASYIKNMFLLSECTTIDNKKIDWSQHDLNLVMNKYHSSLLSVEDLRMLSRTSPWTNMWSTLKENGRIFKNVNLTTEQQVLISWSNMYDRIHESPDCPSEGVLDDDDMLDGWLLVQRKKREADQKKQEVEGAVNTKIANADEIYVKVESYEDAKKIDLLNPSHVNRTKRQRLQQLKEKGVIKEQEFKDVQLKRSMEMRQAFTQQVKGR